MIPAPHRQRTQSLETGLRLLEVFAAQDHPQVLGELAAASRLSPSQAHRYLASLVAAGMARQGLDTGLYELGPQAHQLGVAALSRSATLHRAKMEFQTFADETGASILIAALGPLGPVVVRLIMEVPAIQTSLVNGSSLPLLRSATGQVSLPSGPRPRRGISPKGRWPTTADWSRSISTRFAVAFGRRESPPFAVRSSPACALTAPIFDAAGHAEFAVTALMTDSHAQSGDSLVRRRLERACDAVSRSIGGRRPE